MSLATILLALFLILFGISALAWVAVSGTLIGFVALVAGVLLIIPTINIPVNRK